MPGLLGLSDKEVADREARGEVNTALRPLTRSVPRIIIDNVFTLFNGLNFVLALLVISVGEYKNALFFLIAIANTALGIFQEVRAKLTIDKLSIITQAEVSVMRNGVASRISQEGIVLDDVMLLSLGNQICSDAVLVEGSALEVNESLLTGEANTVLKTVGDTVYSGSFVVAGEAYARVVAVGEENYAHKISANAKYEKKSNSQLMRALNTIIRTLTIVIIPIGLALFLTEYLVDHNYVQSLLASTAGTVGMIPEGLMLLTGIAFAIGAFNLAQHKTLTQSMPSIETLARVSVLCLDKTGTITDGTLGIHEVVSLSSQDASTQLAQYVSAMPDANPTAHALKEKYGSVQDPWEVTGSVPFSSERKWGSMTFEGRGTFILGAPEFVMGEGLGELEKKMDDYAAEGFRLIVFARSSREPSEEGLQGDIIALSLIAIVDHIRPTARETFAFFKDQGVEIKVISGDNPKTVSTIAHHARIEGAQDYVDMSALAEDAPLAEVMEKNTVFGRVSPHQKRDMVAALKGAGKVVAMTGDGVNDVMALRESDVSVAMACGSDAARTVSDFVLVDSDFSSMVNVVKEGRRVVNNIEGVASLYLVKSIYSALLALLFIILPFEYPFQPIQLTLISVFMVGIPSFFLTLQPDYRPVPDRFGQKMLADAIPAALVVVVNLVLIQIFGHLFGFSNPQLSTLSVLLTGATCTVLLFKVSSPLSTPKIAMNITLVILFFLGFVLFQDFFSLTSVFSRIAFLYIPLLLLLYPMYEMLVRLVLWFEKRRWPFPQEQKTR